MSEILIGKYEVKRQMFRKTCFFGEMESAIRERLKKALNAVFTSPLIIFVIVSKKLVLIKFLRFVMSSPMFPEYVCVFIDAVSDEIFFLPLY